MPEYYFSRDSENCSIHLLRCRSPDLDRDRPLRLLRLFSLSFLSVSLTSSFFSKTFSSTGFVSAGSSSFFTSASSLENQKSSCFCAVPFSATHGHQNFSQWKAKCANIRHHCRLLFNFSVLGCRLGLHLRLLCGSRLFLGGVTVPTGARGRAQARRLGRTLLAVLAVPLGTPAPVTRRPGPARQDNPSGAWSN